MPSSFSKPDLDPSSTPPHNSPLLQDNSEAERRLREAEERLRDAMAELQRRQRSAARGSNAELCDHADVSCVANAIGNLCQSFLLSYGVRVGIGILLRAFKLARGHSYSSLLDLKVRKWILIEILEFYESALAFSVQFDTIVLKFRANVLKVLVYVIYSYMNNGCSNLYRRKI